jgi:hypothetical protein
LTKITLSLQPSLYMIFKRFILFSDDFYKGDNS